MDYVPPRRIRQIWRDGSPPPPIPANSSGLTDHVPPSNFDEFVGFDENVGFWRTKDFV